MRFSLLTTTTILISLVVASPVPQTNRGGSGSGASTIAQLQGTFDRNNPNGTPTNPGNEDDLNGDGVINAFEAGAQVAKRQTADEDGISAGTGNGKANDDPIPKATPIGGNKNGNAGDDEAIGEKI